MKRLALIADVLTRYTEGSFGSRLSGSIPRVIMHLTYHPSDIPDMDTWELSVTLCPYREVSEDGTKVPFPEKEKVWRTAGTAPDVCADKLLRELRNFFQSESALKQSEQLMAESLNTLLKDYDNPASIHHMRMDLTELWPKQDPPSEESPIEPLPEPPPPVKKAVRPTQADIDVGVEILRLRRRLESLEALRPKRLTKKARPQAKARRPR